MRSKRLQRTEDRLNVELKFRASFGRADMTLFEWLEGYSLMERCEAIILPGRAYWTPIALKVMGNPPLDALSAQSNVLKAHLEE